MKEKVGSWTTLSRQEAAWLKVALSVAELSTARNKHGAILVRGGSIISSAHNSHRNRTNILSEEHVHSHATVHAEIAALRGVDARGATLYTGRRNRASQPLLGRPCNECYKALVKAGVRKIIYSV